VDERRADMTLALLERAKAGDPDAFGQLAEEHRQALLRLCYRMTGSHEEAEDLVQDTLLKAYSRFGTFELRSALGTWLYRIATNLCLDHQRGRKPWDLDRRWRWPTRSRPRQRRQLRKPQSRDVGRRASLCALDDVSTGTSAPSNAGSVG
jgi:RNA polymerase sigma factor (sigma-70 family)